MTPSLDYKLPSQQRGMTLLEVLISILIMGLGMMGIAAMQSTALRNTQSSLERSHAVIQSYSIIDAIRANKAQALSGAYNTSGMSCQVPSDDGTHASTDKSLWISSLKNAIGSGEKTDTTTCGQISCTNAGICTVIVQWDDQRARGLSDEDQSQETRSVTTVARL